MASLLDDTLVHVIERAMLTACAVSSALSTYINQAYQGSAQEVSTLIKRLALA